jgi:hypothetical protein
MEDFLFLVCHCEWRLAPRSNPLVELEIASGFALAMMKLRKEAHMNIRINYIFWKEGPLLLSRLLACKKTTT